MRPVEYPGWRSRGHGDFRDIRGVMVHHTGSDSADAGSIARGRPDLPGPLSQLHIARDGTVTVVAAGVAWHAGVGMYPWLPTNMGNWHTIGIECANSGTGPSAPHRTNWPDAQYSALVRCCAAINRRLGQSADRTIGHKEYAGRAQGKWDPGAIDMHLLRRDVQARIGVVPSPAPTPTPGVPIGRYADILLFRGSTGAQVAELQRRLKYGYAAYGVTWRSTACTANRPRQRSENSSDERLTSSSTVWSDRPRRPPSGCGSSPSTRTLGGRRGGLTCPPYVQRTPATAVRRRPDRRPRRPPEQWRSLPEVC